MQRMKAEIRGRRIGWVRELGEAELTRSKEIAMSIVYSYHWWHLAPSWIYKGSPDGHPQKQMGHYYLQEALLDVKVYSDAEGQQ